MTVHRSIVVGVDGSPSSLQAVSWAAKEAARRGAPLTLVTAMLVNVGYGVPIGLPDSYFQEEELDAEKRLAEAAECVSRSVPGNTVEVESVVCQGSPARELVERSKSALMVVLGANRRGLIERALLGSVSAAVVAHAHSPVAVVRGLPHVDVNDLSGPVVVGGRRVEAQRARDHDGIRGSSAAGRRTRRGTRVVRRRRARPPVLR